MRQVRCEKKELENVHVPFFELSSTWTLSNSNSNSSSNSSSSQPPSHVKSTRTKKSVEEEEEDRNRKLGELFEWVGMACLGSQRLYVNDRVDPYVCVYEPPTPSRIQNVTHLRWRGLLCPNFVQEVLDTIISSMKHTTTSTHPSFVGITCNALPISPVSYIPYTMSENGSLRVSGDVPARFPRGDSEDTWSLILESGAGEEGSIQWIMGESLGTWDARWG